MLVEPDYKGHRVEATQHPDAAWDAEVRIWRTLSEAKPHVERVTARKPSAKAATEAAILYARRWVESLTRATP